MTEVLLAIGKVMEIILVKDPKSKPCSRHEAHEIDRISSRKSGDLEGK